jgi:WD40 repeat protein
VNGTIYLWDVRNPVQPLAMRPSHQKPCTSLKFSTLHPDCLYSTSDDGSVRVWSTTSNDLTFCAQHALHTSRVGCVDVNPHGRPSGGRLDEYVLSADEGGNVLHVHSSGLSHVTQDSTAQGADLKLQKPVPLQELDASTQHWLQGGTGTGSQLTFPSLLPAKL